MVAGCASAVQPPITCHDSTMPPLIPLRDLFDNPERALARLSPDGAAHLLARAGGRRAERVRGRRGMAARAVPVTDDRDRGVRSYMWSRDARRIIWSQDVGGRREPPSAHGSPPTAGGRDARPHAVPGGARGADRRPAGHAGARAGLDEPARPDAVRRLPAHARHRAPRAHRPQPREHPRLARRPGRPAARRPGPDARGRLRAAGARLARRTSSAWWPATRTRTAATRSPSRPDGSRLWVGSARDSDLIRLVELDPADGSEREIDRDEEVDLSGPMISDVTGELLGAVYLRDRVVAHIWDERLARDWDADAGAPPGRPADHGPGRRRDGVHRRVRRRPRPRRDLPLRPRRRGRRGCSSARGRGSTRRRSRRCGRSRSPRATAWRSTAT